MKFKLIIFLLFISSLTYCKNEKKSNQNLLLGLAYTKSVQDANETKKREFLQTYAEIAFRTYSDSYEAAKNFYTKVQNFVYKLSKTQADLDSLKTEWRKARIPYLKTEVFRFSKGPIDNAELTSGRELEPLFNAWPLDEGHIDGIIQQGNFTKENLIEWNEGDCIGGNCPDGNNEKNISVGWHAIEYILWGQDAPYNNISGQRPISDFSASSPNSNGTLPQRRLAFLLLTSEILVEHLEELKDKWDSQKEGNYRNIFLNKTNDSLDKALRGLARFAGGEWGGERMTGVFEGEQEEEHSCFSDNTKHDFYYDATGFENIFRGVYENEKIGLGLESLIGANNKKEIDENLPISKNFCLNEYDEDSTENNTQLAKCSGDMIKSRFDRMIASLGNGSNGMGSQENKDYNYFRNQIQPAVQKIAKAIQKAAAELGVNIGDDGLKLEN